jgi:transposase-like protein
VKEKTQDRLAEFFVGGGDGSERGGRKPGLTTDMAAKLKTLERENRELRQANEILRKASAYFAQAELDRRYKP